MVGDSLTIADLRLYGLAWWLSAGILDGIPANCLEPYKNVLKLVETCDNHPKIKEWNDAHKKK